jgi:SAM-dependent methyltransferase
MYPQITESGAWNYNESNHDESRFFDQNLIDLILLFLDNKSTKSVLDFGCSTGYYLSYINSKKKNYNLLGIEPHINNRSDLHFQNIVEYDLAKPFDLNMKGEIICLEVLEHINPKYQEQSIQNLINHCNKYLFISWACIGQGGWGHLNEKNLDDVIKLFTDRGFNYLERESTEIREMSTFAWFKTNFCIFEKITI